MVKRGNKLGSLRATPVGLGLSAPIDRRLDQLWYLARKTGQPASRQEIVAALIRDSPTSPAEIKAMLERYRDTNEADVVIRGVPVFSGDGPKKPGRRKLVGS